MMSSPTLLVGVQLFAYSRLSAIVKVWEYPFDGVTYSVPDCLHYFMQDIGASIVRWHGGLSTMQSFHY